MRTLLVALSLLAAFSALSFAVPAAGAFGGVDVANSCTEATNSHCYYMLCIGATQTQYGYYQCQYPIYWPCQYCVPLS